MKGKVGKKKKKVFIRKGNKEEQEKRIGEKNIRRRG